MVTKSLTDAAIFRHYDDGKKGGYKDMKANVGTIDRAVRAIVGIILIALVFVGPQTPWGWIGLIPLATAAFSFCPAYRLLGLNTCRIRGSH